MNSSRHKANILKEGYREVGIGASDPGTFMGYRNAIVWTADFGAR